MSRRRTPNERLIVALSCSVVAIVLGIVVSMIAGSEPTPRHAFALLTLSVLCGTAGWVFPGAFRWTFDFLEKMWSPWW